MNNTIELVFKTPDVLENALEYFEEEEKEAIKVRLEKWIKYGEYVRLIYNIDTDNLSISLS